MVSFLYFWIKAVFPFVIHSYIIASCRHLLSCRTSLSRMDENFSNYNTCMLLSAGFFFSILLFRYSLRVQIYIQLDAFLEFLLLRSLFPYFPQKLFVFFASGFCFILVLFTNFPTEFSLVILECPVLFVSLDLIPVSFEFLFFCGYFLIYFLPLRWQTCLRLSFWNLFILFDSCAFYLRL